MALSGPASTNLRQAAIIVSSLGEELAVEVCSRLPVGQVLALGEEIARLGRVPAEELNEVLRDFLGESDGATHLGGASYARHLLNQALGLRGAADQFRDPDSEGLRLLSKLNEVEPAVLHRALRDERRQTVAAVLSHLTPAHAGQLLSFFDDEVAADIAYRAAHLGSPSPGAMHCLAGALDKQLRSVLTRTGSAPDVSVQLVVDLIGQLPPAKSKPVLDALARVDQGFGDEVAERIFTFEDLGKLADRDLQVVLRNVDMNVLVLALKGTPEEFRERIRSNLSSRGRQRLQEELELLGPVPVTQVQDAQRQIAQDARALADAGEISLDSGGIEYVT